MSGHNKWSTIKRKKGANDAKRSKAFSKIIKEITVAVKEGGADPDSNPRLRMAITNAKSISMPKDNITRAISKGKDKDSANFSEVSYEGYGPHGIAIFVDCTTDNPQRTIANVRSIFTKHNGSIGKNGSLSFLFDRKAIFTINAADVQDPDEFELEAIEAGAEDIVTEDGVTTVTTDPSSFDSVLEALQAKNYESLSAAVSMVPQAYTSVDADTAKKVAKLINKLEENDDVQNVHTNCAVDLDEIEL